MEHYNLERELNLRPTIEPIFDNIPDDWVLTPNDIADLIGMSVVSVRRWCRQGKIMAYQFERKYVITGEHFKSFMRQSRIRSKVVRDVFKQ
jgi:hypothetical protein